ncbi:MAG: (d)CMP kinase [Lachnospiraceae bacterium]|nr:(d)CMP kinase [Lachnospiraceae bacterium]
MGFNVAIDGPAGAGKSTIAKRLAKELGFVYVDTGAMYRAIGLYMLKNSVDGSDEAAVSEAVKNVEVTLSYDDGVQCVYLNGEDVSGMIRTEEVSALASQISAYQAVREKLLDLQRTMAKNNDVLMDGRDIGTTILPNADVKIYLTASVETRAKRRYDEYIAKGQTCDLAEIEEDIKTRDHNDMTRKISPLKKADDAIEVDSSNMNIDEVVETIKNICKEKM